MLPRDRSSSGAHPPAGERASGEGEAPIRYLTTAADRFEADVIAGRLADAGVKAVVEGSMVDRGEIAGRSHDVYVDERDLDRARAALQASQGFDEDELARLSEESYRDAMEGSPGKEQEQG